MKNKNTSCIFEHFGFVYTCDFDKMLMWLVSSEEPTHPITVLNIKKSNGKWYYQYPNPDAPILEEYDTSLCVKLDKNYEQYINQIMVGKNGTTKADKASKDRPSSIPETTVVYES